MRSPIALALLGLILVAPARAGELWTVQAVEAGGEAVCDAFARGMAGRPPYEFRFRRSSERLLLIISYEGPAVGQVREAEIFQDGVALGTLPAQATRFGGQQAVVVSLAPESVDFADLERHHMLAVVVGGQRFEMAMLARDQVAENLERCQAFVRERRR